METDIIYNEDCLAGLSKIPSKSIDLIVIDPPYNIKKDSWDDIKNYKEWMKKVILELQRVLKDNGSFYMFHSEMEVVADFMNFLKNETNFIFRQFIVWNKRFDGSPRKGFLDGFVEVTDLRNYQQMAEYILFYVNDKDFTGLQNIYNNKDCFPEIKEYLRNEKKKSNLTNKKLNLMFSKYYKKEGCVDRSVIEHYFQNVQWVFPTQEIYENILQKTGFFQKPYFELKAIFEENIKQYEEIRLKYEKERYAFNNQKTNHSVWNYDIENKIGHATPKPLELIKNIILHSSKEGQIVLDCFMGSGTTALACKELNRRYIGFEKDPEYCKIISKRLSQQTLSNLSGFIHTSANADPKGAFNRNLQVTPSASPKEATLPSVNPDIKRNRKVCS